MAAPSGNPLWDFSLTLYSQPGVPEVCLTLQDQHGVDVNLLLWAAWLALRGYALSAEELQATLRATEAWRAQVILPLRTVRRTLKNGVDGPAPNLYSTLKSAELDAERIQQDRLYALSGDWTGHPAAHLLRDNLFQVARSAPYQEQAVPVITTLETAIREWLPHSPTQVTDS